MLIHLGAENVRVTTELMPPGAMIHEMGTARMGNDARKSVLNKFNQTHDVKNLSVVDGASFVTSGGYGPTLTCRSARWQPERRITSLPSSSEVSYSIYSFRSEDFLLRFS
jgi:hypothetical protein